MVVPIGMHLRIDDRLFIVRHRVVSSGLSAVSTEILQDGPGGEIRNPVIGMAFVDQDIEPPAIAVSTYRILDFGLVEIACGYR